MSFFFKIAAEDWLEILAAAQSVEMAESADVEDMSSAQGVSSGNAGPSSASSVAEGLTERQESVFSTGAVPEGIGEGSGFSAQSASGDAGVFVRKKTLKSLLERKVCLFNVEINS